MSKIPEISIEELKTKIERKDSFVLLDVREPGEYDQAHIPGSTLIPLGELPKRFGELDKSAEIVVHCHLGGRSARAVQFLMGQGYQAVNVAGGISAWIEKADPSLTLGPNSSCRRS